MKDAGGFIKVKIRLGGCNVERWLVLPERITLEDFHDAIQAAFGWGHIHLWQFKIKNGYTYHIPEDDYDTEMLRLLRNQPGPMDASRCRLCDLLPRRGATAKYIYDFGDNWVHLITRMAPPKETETLCVKSIGPDCEEDFGGCWRWSAYLYLVENGQENTLAQDPDFPREILEAYRDYKWTSEKAAKFLKGPSIEEVTKRMRDQIGKSVDLARIRL